jgi:4-amino-4-deoxychorismate lyase
MFVIYNFDTIRQEDFAPDPLNRSFMYGDSIFETMILKNGKIKYLDDHLERLFHGLKVLDIMLPARFTGTFLNESAAALAQLNDHTSYARIKLQVWRKSGGLIIPAEQEGVFVITASNLTPPDSIKEAVAFFDGVRLSYTPYSAYKTGNMLPYILAGIQLKKTGKDDLILFNNHDAVTECVYSNIFWVKDHTVYTPTIDCGCIAGIMRKQIIRFLKEKNIPVYEGKFGRAELLSADLAFTSNVSGIAVIANIGNKKMQLSNALVEEIKNHV